MNALPRFLLLCTTALLAFLPLITNAQEPAANTLTDAEKADGWVMLFDGTTLDGWKSWRTHKPVEAGSWAVQDGALTLTKKGGGDIYTTEAYEHFDFSIDYKTTGNSGLFLRVNPDNKGAIWHAAPEVQVERNAGKKSTTAGGLYALYDLEKEKVIHPDGWNTIRIHMQDDKATHSFNGKEVFSYTIGSDDWNERVGASKFKKHAAFAKLAKGHIGLQDHGKIVQFRNIKIRALESAKESGETE